MTELERAEIALFITLRNSMIMPVGEAQGKTMEEINAMAYATMLEIYKSIDFNRAKQSYKQGKDLYFKVQESKEELNR